MTRGLAVILAVVFAGCGPTPMPEYITDVESLAAGPAAEEAPEKAPALWKQADEELAMARRAHEEGDQASARRHAQKAGILYKTAIAVTREIRAQARITSAQDRIENAGEELARLRSLRLDAEKRFLDLQEYHAGQKDLAGQMKATFEKDRDRFEEMDGEERTIWLEAEGLRLDRALQAARARIRAADLLGCTASLPSETEETTDVMAKAEAATDAPWEQRRVLVDTASLWAERLLHQTRVMHQPDPLVNPASDEKVVERFVEALDGTGVMVSATTRGILLSFADPGQGGVPDEKTRETLGLIAGALGDGEIVLSVEAHAWSGCTAGECDETSRSLAARASKVLLEGGTLPAGTVVDFHGWGSAPPSATGHCLAEPCPGGRLDVIVLAL